MMISESIKYGQSLVLEHCYYCHYYCLRVCQTHRNNLLHSHLIHSTLCKLAGVIQRGLPTEVWRFNFCMGIHPPANAFCWAAAFPLSVGPLFAPWVCEERVATLLDTRAKADGMLFLRTDNSLRLVHTLLDTQLAHPTSYLV